MADSNPARTVWGDAQTVKYLSDRLTESHQLHGRCIVERDTYQVKYEVLRRIALQVVGTWDEAGPGFMDDLNVEVIRLKEVLGLSTETQPFDFLDQAPA